MTEFKLAVTCFVVVIIISLVLPFFIFSEQNRLLYFVCLCCSVLVSFAVMGLSIRRR